MATTLKEDEAIPASYPTVPSLTIPAAMLDQAALWQRIEAYVAHRWTPRAVVWIVEGCGEWTPPLSPATITETEVWMPDAEWLAVTLAPSPLGGLVLAGDGPWRITADVGGGPTPQAVREAFRRLAEYLTDATDRAGVSSYSVNMGGAIEESYQRNPAWVARAMELSGAADLLRRYKRRA